MSHVDDFFDRHDLMHNTKVQRTVYLATDEVTVLAEAKSK